MSLVVNTPYKKPGSRKMNSLTLRWDQLRKLAKAELSLSYPNLNLASTATLRQGLK